MSRSRFIREALLESISGISSEVRTRDRIPGKTNAFIVLESVPLEKLRSLVNSRLTGSDINTINERQLRAAVNSSGFWTVSASVDDLTLEVLVPPVRSAHAREPVGAVPVTEGYHVRDITRGTYGEFSKIVEEFEELLDAHEQGVKIMELCEISDLYGALRGYVERHFGMTMDDVAVMSKRTDNAFRSGARTPRD